MTPHDKLFSMAIKCIPPAEKARNQMITLKEGDLYFISSSRNSWVVIEKFMETDLTFTMTIENLRTVLSQGAEISVSSVGEHSPRIRFSSGGSRIDCGVLTEVELPRIVIPAEDRFQPIPELFRLVSGFNSLVDENMRMSTIDTETGDVMYLLETRRFMCGVCYTGDDEIINTNFTNIYEAINEAASVGGKYYRSGDLLYLSIQREGEPWRVVSCMRITPQLASAEARAVMSRFISGKLWENMDHVKVTVKLSDYDAVMTVAGRLTNLEQADIDIRDGVMKITVTDTILREYERVIPCEASASISFSALLFPGTHLRVLSSVDSHSKKEDQKIDMYILLHHLRLIVTIPDPIDDYYPFILYPVRTS